MSDPREKQRRTARSRAAESPFTVQRRVLGALILYNMNTRFGAGYFGYIRAITGPFLYMALLVTMYALIRGRVALVGHDPIVFFGTGLLTVIMFLYPARGMIQSIKGSKPLLRFPIVQIFDAMAARFVLEAMTAYAACALVVAVGFLINVNIDPQDTGAILLGLLAALLLGLSFGTVNAVAVMVYGWWGRLVGILMTLMWISSGAVFPVERIPHPYRGYLQWNPLYHAIEWVRDGYYAEYESTTLNIPYILGISVLLLVLGLAWERQVRGRIREQ